MTTESVALSNIDVVELEELASFGLSVKDIAIHLGVDVDELSSAYANEDSQIYYHIQRGILMSEIDVFRSLNQSAKAGNQTAIAELGKVKRDKSFSSAKLDIFGGFELKASLDKIDAFLKGCDSSLSPKEALYMEVLSLVVSLDKRYEKRGAIRFLTSPPINMTYAKASDIYHEAINLFYADKGLSKSSLRAKYAENIELAAQVVLSTAKTSKDFEVYGNLLIQAAKIRQLDKEDIDIGDKISLLPSVKIYSIDADAIGLGRVDRRELAKFIDNDADIPANAKNTLRQEAMIEDIKFEELLNNAQKRITDR